MKLRLLLVITALGLAIGLIPTVPAFSAESTWQASVGAEGRDYNVSGNMAKFNEYRDLKSGGVFGKVDAKYDSPTYGFSIMGKDMGYDTQHYRLEGGAYGKFKYFLDYNEIVHNVTEDAKTLYSGAGDAVLGGNPALNQNPDIWSNSFDYSTKRKKLSTGLGISVMRPFFFNISYGSEKKEGIKPTGVSSNMPGASSVELPEPIDYKTNTFKAEGGYSKNPFFLSFSYLYSDFSNGTQDLFFTPPAGGLAVPLSLAPDNTSHKLAMKGSIKLPFNSRFSVHLADGKTTSSSDSFPTFDGRVDTRNYDLTFTSNPLRFLDVKAYYKYYERDNKSSGSQLFNGNPTPVVPFYYKNEVAGAEVGVKLPAKFYLNGGYKIVQTDRYEKGQINPAAVLPYTYDNVYFADMKWSGLDVMVAKIGYERLARGADYRTFESSQEMNRKFAYAAQDRDTLKIGVDLFPSEAFNLGLEYRYKKADYNDTILGVREDERNAFSFNADYAFRKFAKLSGYFDYEKVVVKESMLTGQTLPAPQPSAWRAQQDEKTYGYGLRADVFAVPNKLTFVLQHDYVRNIGNSDFTFFDPSIYTNIGVPAGSPISSIPNWDSYQLYSYRITALYNWTKSLTMKLGYAYERYKYSDAQYNSYQYYNSASPGSSQGYLTGAYANPSYSANILFGGLTYRF
jgi:MtrB/PioB family decaheme-associated outer membrane protein